MHILLDECVNPRLKLAFPDHQVTTVADANWRALADAQLLALADKKFDVFITLDQGFAHQQNPKRRSFGIVIVHVTKNSMQYYRPIFNKIREAVDEVGPGQIAHVYATESL